MGTLPGRLAHRPRKVPLPSAFDLYHADAVCGGNSKGLHKRGPELGQVLQTDRVQVQFDLLEFPSKAFVQYRVAVAVQQRVGYDRKIMECLHGTAEKHMGPCLAQRIFAHGLRAERCDQIIQNQRKGWTAVGGRMSLSRNLLVFEKRRFTDLIEEKIQPCGLRTAVLRLLADRWTNGHNRGWEARRDLHPVQQQGLQGRAHTANSSVVTHDGNRLPPPEEMAAHC